MTGACVPRLVTVAHSESHNGESFLGDWLHWLWWCWQSNIWLHHEGDYHLEFYFSSSLQRVRGSDWLLPLICIRWPGIDVWPGPGLGILFVCVFPRYSQHTGNEYRALETQTKHPCPASHPLVSTFPLSILAKCTSDSSWDSHSTFNLLMCGVVRIWEPRELLWMWFVQNIQKPV